MKNAMLKIFRKILGTELIREKQKIHWEKLQYLQGMLLAQGNILQYSMLGLERVKTTFAYKHCLEIVSLLSPMDVKGGKYLRIGRNYDGGYVMLDNFQQKKFDAAYSFGIYDDISWDEAIGEWGTDIFMYDPSIDQLPKNHPKFHFFKKGLTGFKKMDGFKTLGEFIADNKHSSCKNMIMKMDVEGCEWDVFKEIKPDTLNQFAQFVVEFHDLSSAVYNPKFSIVVDVLKKINQTHQIVHVHGNNCAAPLWIGDLVLPSSLEVTYVRRSDAENTFIPNSRQFPTEIDQPNFESWPDIFLGEFSPKGKI